MPAPLPAKIIAGLLCASALSACATTMAPRYERPSSPAPSALPYAEEHGNETAALVSWRAVFIDPELQRLIETGLENNRDLRLAVLNAERARALYRVQRSDSLPSINAGYQYTRQRTGANAATGIVGASTSGRTEPITTVQNTVSASVSSYELDLFGRVRSLNKQALESYFAEEETRKAAEVTIIAEIASAYLQLVADTQLLAIAEETVKNQQASLDLTERLLDSGVGNDIDVQRVRISIEQAKADAASLAAQVERDRNALRLLLGTATPDDLKIASTIDAVKVNDDIPVGLNSDILLNRPDIQAAEHQLKAANASIGAARAAFFPQILLTGSAGTASAELTDLFAPGTGVWRFAPSVSVPIFTGGRNLAQLSGAKIDRDIAKTQYEQSIESAFRDIADALATRETIDERVNATERLAEASAKAFNLSDLRFQNGVDDYFAVLEAQRTDYAARQQLVAAQLAKSSNAVNFFRSIGGPAEEQQATD
ncbi:MAG: efflux transporter outer membrane subunit [Parvularculaceae bacterium]